MNRLTAAAFASLADRRIPAAHPLPSHRARDHAQGRRACGSALRYDRARRPHADRHGHRDLTLPPHAGLDLQTRWELLLRGRGKKIKQDFCYACIITGRKGQGTKIEKGRNNSERHHAGLGRAKLNLHISAAHCMVVSESNISGHQTTPRRGT